MQYYNLNEFLSQEIGQDISKIDINFENQYNERITSKLKMLILKNVLLSVSLNFVNSKIDQNNIEGLNLCIQKCQSIKQLKLYLHWNSLGSEGSLTLGQAISECKFLEKLTLTLGYNSIGVNGIKNLVQGIEQCQFLTSLNLDLFTNSLGYTGIKLCMESISKMNNLISLNLDLKTNFIGAEGAQEISLGIEKLKNLKILSLYLGWNNIGSEGVLHLIKGIRKQQKIVDVFFDLYENFIKNVPLKMFKQKLKKSKYLVNMKLINVQ